MPQSESVRLPEPELRDVFMQLLTVTNARMLYIDVVTSFGILRAAKDPVDV